MSDKHKRNITQNLSNSEINKLSETIENMLRSLDPKQQHIMAEWLDVWCEYISFEKSFSPQKLKYYKRGEIVLVNFGYNVGSELGGVHYAVVVEKDNNKSSNTVMVVPLSSLEDGKCPEDLHKSEVYLGNIIPNSDKLSYAKPLQMRTVSKLRIIKPKSAKDSVCKINAEQLGSIDEKIKSLLTRKDKIR